MTRLTIHQIQWKTQNEKENLNQQSANLRTNRSKKKKKRKDEDDEKKRQLLSFTHSHVSFITNLRSTLGWQFAHIFRMTSILSLKVEKTWEQQQQQLHGKKVVIHSCRESQLGKKKEPNLDCKMSPNFQVSSVLDDRGFLIRLKNCSVQFTFSLEGWTDEHQRGVDLRLRGASVAASLRHAVVSAQNQQVGQRSVRLLRAENSAVSCKWAAHKKLWSRSIFPHAGTNE